MRAQPTASPLRSGPQASAKAGLEAPSSEETLLATPLTAMASWLLFAAIAAYGLSLTSNINAVGAYVTTGGLYSGTDGMWAEWNASSIMRFGQFLDPSPFNAFAGMGSMFLPNLPWLNPGALMLAAPVGRHQAYVLSYLVYMIEVGAALTVLARTIGFSWLVATIAAELHILLLFPPFSAFFMPLEWYSAAPVYAHLTALWCFALGAFMACGRKGGLRDILAATGFVFLVLAGILSAPFSFIFFSIPIVILGLVLVVARPHSLRELRWKAGAVAAMMLATHFAGFTDYLVATVANSARTPLGATDWSLLLSPASWIERIFNHSLCGTDPRGLICRNDPLWWLQALALAGSLYLALAARGGRRAAGVWCFLFLAGLHLYAYAYQTGILGPIGTLSTHFLSWSAYAVLPVLAVGGACLAATALASATDTLHPAVARMAPIVALLAVPAAAGYIAMKPIAPGRPDTVGREPITDAISGKIRIGLNVPFRGYAATFWSPAVDAVDESGMAARSPAFRYIHARTYFLARYGTTFTETDLWRAGIPTFEEYGQWVSRQSQVLARGLLADPDLPRDHPTFLRIYRLDTDIMRALGIRFLITDLLIKDDPRLNLLARESAPDAFAVYLYEIAEPNLATYSPTRAVRVPLQASAALPRIAAAAKDLQETVFVTESMQGPFTPASRSWMLLQRDGYRVVAEADGPSLLLLPIQFSHCLRLADNAGDEFRPRLFRANFAETGVLFKDRLDARIEFDFGLFGNAACRLDDGRDVAAMTAPPS